MGGRVIGKRVSRVVVTVATGIEGECVCPNQQVSCLFPLRGCLRLRGWAFQREGVREEAAPCPQRTRKQPNGVFPSVGWSVDFRALCGYYSLQSGLGRLEAFHPAKGGMPESAFTMQLSRSSGKESRSNRGRLRRLAVSPVIAYGRRGGFLYMALVPARHGYSWGIWQDRKGPSYRQSRRKQLSV